MTKILRGRPKPHKPRVAQPGGGGCRDRHGPIDGLPRPNTRSEGQHPDAAATVVGPLVRVEIAVVDKPVRAGLVKRRSPRNCFREVRRDRPKGAPVLAAQGNVLGTESLCAGTSAQRPTVLPANGWPVGPMGNTLPRLAPQGMPWAG